MDLDDPEFQRKMRAELFTRFYRRIGDQVDARAVYGICEQTVENIVSNCKRAKVNPKLADNAKLAVFINLIVRNAIRECSRQLTRHNDAGLSGTLGNVN